MTIRTTVIALLTVLTGQIATAQLVAPPKSKGCSNGEQVTTQVQIGMKVTAEGGPCMGLLGTVPVPLEWPEQEVRIVDEDISGRVVVRNRETSGTVRQLVISIPYLPAGEEAHALITYELKRASLNEPEDVKIFEIPKRVTNDIRPYLNPSPGIESRSFKIRQIARDALADKRDASAWEQVEALYDWTRENVEYRNGPFKGAMAAIKDGYGDCEELSSVFIALCRASDIPARTVWIPGHCYPEFYLLDDEGNGHWLPCQAAGTRAFGSMPEHRPILQKGDNFKVPERPRDAQRYCAEYLTGKGGKPRVQFVRDVLGNEEAQRGVIDQ